MSLSSRAAVVRPGGGRAGHLPAAPNTVLWGRLPAAGDTPVMTIRSGESVVFDTVSHEGIMDDQGRDPVAYFGAQGIEAGAVLGDAIRIAAEVPRHVSDGPHVVSGPIYVEGAQPGDVLAMTLEWAEPRTNYGLVSNRHGRGALPDQFPAPGLDVFSVLARVTEAGRGRMPADALGQRHVEFPLNPFLGIMGVAVAEDERPHSVPPGAYGGNLDISLMSAGATVFVPVQVPGALAYVGDPHYAQGDGEVSLTAFEAPLRAQVRFEVLPGKGRPLWIETAELLVPVGLDPDLGTAMRKATRNAIDLLVDRGMAPAHAYAYLSAAADFSVSQVVDRTCGVHGKIRKADLIGLEHPTP